MGLLDKVKGMFGGKSAGDSSVTDTAKDVVQGNEETIKQGVDTAADKAGDVVPDEHAGKVDQAAEKGKDAVDKLGD
jgi:hypothetical protein